MSRIFSSAAAYPLGVILLLFTGSQDKVKDFTVSFAVFQRYNNPNEEDLKEVVLADPPRAVVQEG